MKEASKPLIGLCGYKGSGKDTAAGHLVKFYGFEKRAFATKLKEAVANLLGCTIEQVDEWKDDREIPYAEVILQVGTTQWSWTWREFLQRFGTEMGRNTFGTDFWVNLAMGAPFYNPTVFTDARLPNEQRAIKEIGGKIVWVERPGYDSDGHASEQKPPIHMIDYVLHNKGDHVDLFQRVEEMMTNLYGSDPV